MASNRRNITWDLSRVSDYELSVYWTEPEAGTGEPKSHHLLLHSLHGPWKPWQIAGVVSAIESGADPALVDAPKAPPRPSIVSRALHSLSDSLFDLADRLTTGRNWVGDAR